MAIVVVVAAIFLFSFGLGIVLVALCMVLLWSRLNVWISIQWEILQHALTWWWWRFEVPRSAMCAMCLVAHYKEEEKQQQHTHSKRRWCCQIVFFYFSFCFSSSWWFFTLSFFFGLNKIVCDQLPLVAFFYANKKIRCRIYHLFTSKQYLKPRGDNCCWCCHGGCHRHFIPWVNVLSLREKIV